MAIPTQSHLTGGDICDQYFMETRCKLIEIAATLDRLDRAADRSKLNGDARLLFIQDALAILASDAPNRAEAILRRYSLPASDVHTQYPLPSLPQ
ncbi:MAG: hypothetical protein WCJ97_00345 [Phycisphaerae bacterium]